MRSRELIERARTMTTSLLEQVRIVQQQIARSRSLLERTTEASALPIYGTLPSALATDTPPANADGATRSFAAVTELIEQVERATAQNSDMASRMIEDILLALHGETEPSLLIGILLEGIAETVLRRLPSEERRDTAIALCGLLWDRVSQGLAGQN